MQQKSAIFGNVGKFLATVRPIKLEILSRDEFRRSATFPTFTSIFCVCGKNTFSTAITSRPPKDKSNSKGSFKKITKSTAWFGESQEKLKNLREKNKASESDCSYKVLVTESTLDAQRPKTARFCVYLNAPSDKTIPI